MKKSTHTGGCTRTALLTSAAHAQLNNSWIDYNQDYTTNSGVEGTRTAYLQSTLAAARPWLNSTDASAFQLWRNGKQVRISSVASGQLGLQIIVEFGKRWTTVSLIKQLYRNEGFQLATGTAGNRYGSIFSCVSRPGGSLRYVAANNPSQALPHRMPTSCIK